MSRDSTVKFYYRFAGTSEILELLVTLSNMGIVKGTADGSFKPNAEATRSESLLMILRMLNVSLGLSLDIE
ncbi:S-layer homology domain-containing protein [Cohnella sp. WQ 127256]|uniref:S-layer homology domain-containing protein n=1 Tax=Cohnella sp. WQ 127256 TaxID=2938790 RepID=UPI002118AC26|nr:S-layer homology domain-containing protein [Cohnella sp. WQ 127256]